MMKLRPYAIPAVWILAGFLSWCLYTYVLAGLVLPLVHGVISAAAGAGVSRVLVSVVEVLLRHIPEYLLGFGVCLVLARVYGLTGIRISGFIVAANAIPCYYHLLQFFGFFRHNAGLSLEPLGLMIPGFISCILISPFSAVLGGILGKFWRQKPET